MSSGRLEKPVQIGDIFVPPVFRVVFFGWKFWKGYLQVGPICGVSYAVDVSEILERRVARGGVPIIGEMHGGFSLQDGSHFFVPVATN